MSDQLNLVLDAANYVVREFDTGDERDMLKEAIETLRKVAEERARQDATFGVPKLRGYTHGDWMMVLVEEVGEVAKAMQDGTREELIEEVVDVCAVALAMLEAMCG